MHITTPAPLLRSNPAPTPQRPEKAPGLDGFEDPEDGFIIGTSTVLG